MPEAAPRSWAGTELDDGRGVRGGEQAAADPVGQQDQREDPVVEVHRDHQQTDEAGGHDQQATGREQAGAVAVGEPARGRAGGEEAHRQGQHVDAGPERRGLEVVAVLGQPDALEPDDQHELEPTPADRGHQAGQVAHAERADPEQGDRHHRVLDPLLDQHEGDEQQHATDQAGEDPGVRPAGGVRAVRLDPVGDRHEEGGQPDPEREVAGYVDPAPAPLAELDAATCSPRRSRGCRSARSPRTPRASATRRAGRR